MAKKEVVDDLGEELNRMKKERDEWRDHAQECERERQWLRAEYMKLKVASDRRRPTDDR